MNFDRSIDRLIVTILCAASVAALVTAVAVHPGGLPANTPIAAVPAAALRPGTTSSSVDLVEVEGQRFPVATGPVSVPKDTSISIVGWAVDPKTGAPPASIEVRSEDGTSARAGFGIPREDVAAALARPGAINSGFAVSLKSGSPGRHVLHFAAVTVDGRRLALPATVTLIALP